jgi:hypothetical protein
MDLEHRGFVRRNHKLILALSLCLLMLLGGFLANNYFTKTLFDLSMSISLPTNNQETFGTLFITKPSQDGMICGAGFINSEHSRVNANQNDLEFWCNNLNAVPQLKFKNLGKVYPQQMRAVIANVNGSLVNYRASSNEVYYYGKYKWSRLEPYGHKYLMREQKINNNTLYFYWHENSDNEDFSIYENDRKIGEFEGNVSAVLFYNDYFYINTDNKFLSCPYKPDMNQEMGKCNLLKTQFPVWTYSFFPWRGYVYTGTAANHIYKMRGTEIKKLDSKIQERKNVTLTDKGEFYSYLIYKDSLLMGHYPSGYFFKISENDSIMPLIEFPPTTNNDYSDPDEENLLYKPYQELQSSTFVNGMLVAGMYPWGIVRLQDYQSKWHEYRIFSEPKRIHSKVSPYVDELQQLIKNPNVNIQRAISLFTTELGQRITSMAVFNDKLCVGTGNMDGVYGSANKFDFLSYNDINQYGSIFCSKLLNHTLSHIYYKENSPVKLEFQVKKSLFGIKIYLKQDGHIIAKNKIELANKNFPDKIDIIGKGQYGPFIGKLNQVNMKREYN